MGRFAYRYTGIPVVAHRRNRGEWLVTMQAEDLWRINAELNKIGEENEKRDISGARDGRMAQHQEDKTGIIRRSGNHDEKPVDDAI